MRFITLTTIETREGRIWTKHARVNPDLIVYMEPYKGLHDLKTRINFSALSLVVQETIEQIEDKLKYTKFTGSQMHPQDGGTMLLQDSSPAVISKSNIDDMFRNLSNNLEEVENSELPTDSSIKEFDTLNWSTDELKAMVRELQKESAELRNKGKTLDSMLTDTHIKLAEATERLEKAEETVRLNKEELEKSVHTICDDRNNPDGVKTFGIVVVDSMIPENSEACRQISDNLSIDRKDMQIETRIHKDGSATSRLIISSGTYSKTGKLMHATRLVTSDNVGPDGRPVHNEVRQ